MSLYMYRIYMHMYMYTCTHVFLIKERIPEYICRKINADHHVSVVFNLKQPDCYYHTDCHCSSEFVNVVCKVYLDINNFF